MEFEDDPNLIDRILWLDEKNFSRKGIHNIHNQHHWAHENPRVFRIRKSGEVLFLCFVTLFSIYENKSYY